MANIIKNTLLGTGALAGTEYLTNGLVSNVIMSTAGTVSNILASMGPMPAFAVAAAPFALAGYATYKGIKEEGAYNGLERSLLTYGLGGVAATATGLLSIPLAPQILAAGAGMYGIKKITSAIAESYSIIKDAHPIDYVVDGISNMPGKVWNGIKNKVGFAK